MGLKGRFFRWLAGGYDLEPLEFEAIFGDAESETRVRELAFVTAVGKIARIMSGCEIRTYLWDENAQKAIETRGNDYFRLNYQPNCNQNGPDWMKELIWTLFSKNEALIVEIKDELYIADSYTVDEYPTRDWVFREVMIGDKKQKTFKMSEVLYIRLAERNVKAVIDGIYTSYSKMLGAASEAQLQSTGFKGVMTIQGQRGGDGEQQKKQAEIIQDRLRGLWENQNAIVSVQQGYNFQDLNKDRQMSSTRDYRAMIDDVFDFTALAFGIPPAMLRPGGDAKAAGALFNQFLTDCIDPLAHLISTEMTRTLFTKQEILERGNYIQIDTSKSEHFNLFGNAGQIEKLIGSGVLTINEMRTEIGRPKTDDPIADEHLITKNFGTAEEITGEAPEKEDEGEEDEKSEATDD